MNFRVKICGITNWRDARMALDAGADALGFNFYPKSPRCISPASAWDILRRLPRRVLFVGVFVNWGPEAVSTLAKSLRLAAVQLHGDEPPRAVSAVSKSSPVVKAFRVTNGFHLPRLRSYSSASAFLLDGYRAGLRGGSGNRFDWSVARRASTYGPIVLAGGLTPENVAEAIATAQPMAVDVASGVESQTGKKDPRKVRDFVRAAREAFAELNR